MRKNIMSSHFAVGLRNVRVAGLTIALFAAMCAPLLAQAPSTADTFVSSSTPKLNYGPSIILAGGAGTNSYVQFNLSGIPAGASISKATLRLYVDAVSGSGTLDVFQVTSSWGENKVTYSTRPTQQSVSAIVGSSIPITSASYNQFLLIDITPLAQGWLNGTIPNNGVALALTGGSGTFSIDSKESLLTGNGPELEIALANGSGPQGPVGPAGVIGPQGPPGAAGAAGATGATGATGPQGLTGAVGPKGDTGAIGPQGPVGSQGTQGLQGLSGPMGLPGAQGPQGDAGPQGVAGTGFTFKGPFENTANYAVNDVATFSGSSYVAKSATNPGDPTPDSNPNWSLMAQQGAAGPAGAAGAQGAVGPQGIQGPMGFQGPQGPQGVAPPGTAVTNAPNTFAASQTVNGNLILGAGGAVQFADGTTQNTAASSGSGGTCSSFEITSSSPVVPAGYVAASTVTAGNLWFSVAPMPTARSGLAAATINGKIYAIGGGAESFLNPGA